MKIEFDKYYTPVLLANHCWDKIIEICGNVFSEIIEPSVGNGSFLHYEIVPNFGYDILPQCETTDKTEIIKDDFLNIPETYLQGRLFIGNPPYGDKMNLAKKFYKKCTRMGDYIAFILPISQLNNTNSMYEFDLIYSEDLGVQDYSDTKLHCCFNIYKRPNSGRINKKPTTKINDITIYRQDSKDYDKKDFDVRMCYWGDGTCGKILKDEEHYSAEYKIKINNSNLYNRIYDVLVNYNWRDYVKCIAMKKIQQFHIIDVLKKEIPELSEPQEESLF